jgi:ABC-type oligopeptide transport system substrate-binding subunit
MRQHIKTAGLIIVSLAFLAGCNHPTESSESVSNSDGSTSSQDKGSYKYDLANGTLDYSGASYEEKAKITAELEKYGMTKHIAGIPLYDDAGYTVWSSRVTAPTNNYIMNYGWGLGNGTLDPAGTIHDDKPISDTSDWKNYFHDYTNTDSGTFNYWDSTGSDVAGRNGMITGSYFGVTLNDTKTDFLWRGELSKTDAPIMIDKIGGSAITDATQLKGTGKYWRVKVHHDEDGYVYSVPSTSPHYAAFNGTKIALADYITPFKAMFDNKLSRYTTYTAESSGFEGVNGYVNSKTKDWSDVGIQINEAEGAIDFAFLSPKTSYYAMVNLSSGLNSPVPQSFLDAIGGAESFGKIVSNADPKKTLDNFISCGPYLPIYWEVKKELVYVKNSTYFLSDEYHFDGLTEQYIEDEDAAWEAWNNCELDECTVPSKQIKSQIANPLAHKSLGQTVIKMNVNSCTEDEWNYYFGKDGTMYHHADNKSWDVKPIMSNDDFLDGVYFSINRTELAAKTGRNVATGYLSNAYMANPEEGLAYRKTEQGEAAIAEYVQSSANYAANKDSHPELIDGYNRDLAKTLFKKAMSKLEADGAYSKGTEAEPTLIELKYFFRYQQTIDDYGSDLSGYITSAFNEACPGYKLVITEKQAGPSYTDCYTLMDHGEYDFGDGAIQGNVLNPVEFMSCLCSDGLAQGFCLNWGEITAEVSQADADGNGPLYYDNKTWSYDGLYSAANASSIITNGKANPALTVAAASSGTGDDAGYAMFECAIPDLTDDEGRNVIEYTPSKLVVFLSKGQEMAEGTYNGYAFTNIENESDNPTAKAKIRRTESKYVLMLSKTALQEDANAAAQTLKLNINSIYVQFTVSYEMLGSSKSSQVTWNVDLKQVGVNPVVYTA